MTAPVVDPGYVRRARQARFRRRRFGVLVAVCAVALALTYLAATPDYGEPTHAPTEATR